MRALAVCRWPLAVLLFAGSVSAQTTRIASDFELRQMERQVAQAKDFLSQISGHLNLGDAHAVRGESAASRAEVSKALQIASGERLEARRVSALTRYATATSYAALAAARLGDDANAFALSEEAIRYTSDSDKTWNLYANTMQAMDRPAKAVSAARNAVTIAARGGDPLNLAVDQYTLASALLDEAGVGAAALGRSAAGETPAATRAEASAAEAQTLLQTVVHSLHSDRFASLRRDIARGESFEIYSTARGEAAAYISLLDRAQLRLGRLYEDHGHVARAREQYRNVLAGRSDDPIALAALARLAETPAERERWYVQAFDANPFSLSLIRDYQAFLRGVPASGPSNSGDDSTGAQIRLALQQMQRGEFPAAISTITTVERKFPNNDTLALLRREIDERRAGGPVVLRPNPTAADLRSILAAFQQNRLTPEQRARLDTMTFASSATFIDPQSGTIDGVPFRLSQPATFQGSVQLKYRILGATEQSGADALLLEVAP